MNKLTSTQIKLIKHALKKINSASNILITTHISPDEDAIGSLLATHAFLKQLNKKVQVYIEDPVPSRHSFLKSSVIKQSDLAQAIESHQIDLIIFLDGNDMDRFSRQPEQLINIITQNKVITICLDHHHTGKPEQFQTYLNLGRSSTAETVYILFVDQNKQKLNLSIAQSLMMAILGDTGRFLYQNPHYQDTFSIASSLIDHGADIEKITSQIRKFHPDELKIISWLIANLQIEDGYNYSYLTETQLKEVIKQNITPDHYTGAYHHFIDNYIRSLAPNQWGFVLVPDYNDPKFFKGSMRSIDGVIDTTVFAQKFNGGGHKQASGFRLPAKNIKEALKTVLKVIKNNYPKALKTA